MSSICKFVYGMQDFDIFSKIRRSSKCLLRKKPRKILNGEKGLLWRKDFVSSYIEKIPSKRLLGRKGLHKFFNEEGTFKMSSMERRPWKVLLWTENLESSTMKRRASKSRLKVFYGEMGFERSFMKKKPSKIVL